MFWKILKSLFIFTSKAGYILKDREVAITGYEQGGREGLSNFFRDRDGGGMYVKKNHRFYMSVVYDINKS